MINTCKQFTFVAGHAYLKMNLRFQKNCFFWNTSHGFLFILRAYSIILFRILLFSVLCFSNCIFFFVHVRDSLTLYYRIFTLSETIPDTEKKLTNIFFNILCGTSKGFMKALKAFIKPSETPQKSENKNLS